MNAPDPRRQLGLEVKRIADASPLLKKQVARRLGVSPALLSNWFAGRVVPSKDHLDALIAFASSVGIEKTPLRELWSRARSAADTTIDGDAERLALVDFFGADVEQSGITLSYPEFLVQDGRLLPKDGAELHADLEKYPKEVAGDRLGGFGAVVSSFDLDAIAVMLDLFADNAVIARVGVDADVLRDGAQYPVVSFGLQTNALTTFHIRSAIMNGSAGRPLFSADRTDLTRVELRDGTVVQSAPPVWRGVVARHTPRPMERPTRKWFFCAGLGGVGTSLAATYLATYWRELHHRVAANDFVAVIAGHELTPAAATCEHLLVAE